MKRLTVLSTHLALTFFISACGVQDEFKETDLQSQESISTAINVGAISSAPAVKTFNQINLTYSKITGIESSDSDIVDEYQSIKNSLPANYDTGSFTPFHQVATTRLSFAYCNAFIKKDPEFSALDYNSLNEEQISTKLLERFIGQRNQSNASRYDSVSNEINAIMNNEAGQNDQGASIGELVPNATGATLKKNLAALGCTAVLASAEFVIL